MQGDEARVNGIDEVDVKRRIFIRCFMGSPIVDLDLAIHLSTNTVYHIY